MMRGSSSPSRLMRKLPEPSRVSAGRSRGREPVRVVRADIISSVSCEQVEVGSSWRDWRVEDDDVRIVPTPKT